MTDKTPSESGNSDDWFSKKPSSINTPQKGCYLHEPERLAQQAPVIVHALIQLKKYSVQARALINWAEKNNILFQQKEMPAAGTWNGSAQRVSINTSVSPELAISIMAHELHHGVQYIEYKLRDNKKPNRDFRSDMFDTLCMEAGAFTFQLSVAFEMKLNGYDKAWNALRHMNEPDAELQKALCKYQAVAEAFQQGYEEALVKGLDQEKRLQSGRTKAQAAYLKSSKIIACYGRRDLRFYFNNIAKGHLKTPPITHIEPHRFNKAFFNIHGTAQVDHINFPNNDQKMFRENADLMFAVNHLEKLRTNLASQNNPLPFEQTSALSSKFSDPLANPFNDFSLADIANARTKRQDRCVFEAMIDLKNNQNKSKLKW